jgi:hypothetical protein
MAIAICAQPRGVERLDALAPSGRPEDCSRALAEVPQHHAIIGVRPRDSIRSKQSDKGSDEAGVVSVDDHQIKKKLYSFLHLMACSSADPLSADLATCVANEANRIK